MSMNRHPIATMNQTQESLARLAEIANVVSRHQNASAFAQSMSMVQGHVPNSSSSFAPSLTAALRKRPNNDSDPASSEDKPQVSKKAKIDDAKDVRFREYQAEIWSEKFEDLCEFRKFFGHCHVPHTYERNAPLAQWVKRQRYQYKLKLEGKRSTLSDERVRLLNQIGFIWNSHDAVWEERWVELTAYKNAHGHCIVPSNYEKNPQLAVWVKRQRRQYKFYCEGKATSMTPERIEKLEKIGFAWDCRKGKSDSDDDDDGDTSTSSPVPEPTARQNGAAKKESTVQNYKPPTVAYPRNEFFSFSQGPSQKKESSKAPTISVTNAHPRCEFFSFSKVAKKKEITPPAQPKPQAQPQAPKCEFVSFSQKKFTKFPNIKLSKF